MTFWMFRHKPTGLFFKNRRSTYKEDQAGINLKEMGKAFFHKPHGFDWIKSSTFYAKIQGNKFRVGSFVESDWEIVEFNSAEQSTQPTEVK